jgi:flagellar basal body-associated protein FliL
MAPSKRTWLWIVLAALGLCVIFVIAIAGVGVYLVSSHVSTKTSTTAEAFSAFDAARAPFKDLSPVYEVDDRERVKQVRKIAELPDGKTRARQMQVLVWDADRERLVKVSVPFWVLRMGHQKIDIADSPFELERLQLDVKELERVGPVLLLDLRSRGGQRVLIWTQ